MARAPVLIVDDSPANLKLARVALEAEGYEVRTAADGEEAWRMLGSFTPSSILMDLQLPGLDGFELTQRIKADPALQHVPIIAVTAYAMKGDRERALAVGCDGYISKPLDPILLPQLVANHLPGGAPNRRAGEPREADQATILVIEDNPTTRKLIRVALESDGHRICEAAEAQSALNWLERHQPQLIIQDLMLPDMDGLELVQRLRALPHGRDVPVLCLSGFIARMDDARAMTHSFSALLVKPIDPMQLLEVVRVQLEAPRSQPPRATAADAPRVLVVDDDPLQRRLAEFQLTGAGFSVSAVAGAKRAIAEAERQLPAAIVSDVLMPEMDGFELCLAIRSHPQLAQVPVVLVSSHYTEPADRKLAERVGAGALVPRTGDWDRVVRRVREVIEQRSAPPPALQAESAREAILHRTQAQLERQLQMNRRSGQQCLFQTAQLSVLARISDALALHTKLDDVLGDALSVCLDLAGISKGALYLRRNGRLEPKHWFGFGSRDADALSQFFGHAELIEQILATGQVCTMPAPALAAVGGDDFLRRAGLRAALIVPVSWAKHSYGALLLGARTAEVTGQEAVAFARVLGGQLGQAMGLAEAFERLHASEEKFRMLVSAMDSVMVVDRDQRITGIYGRGLEASQLDVLGRTLQDVMPHERAAHDDAHTRALAGESVSYEWSLSDTPNARYFQSAVFPVRDASGQISSIVRVGREVTEQKHLQTQILLSDRMASVGMLAAGVAHEINSPLMAVIGNLKLALDDARSGRNRNELPELLSEAFDAAQRVEAIVRDLRLFSRAEEEAAAEIDVHKVLDSTLRMARNEIRHRAQLVRDFGLVPAVRGNASRLGQVFLNLLINAAQAIPDGHADANEIRVSTRLIAPDRVVVEIADTGPGVPRELQPKLFTPFVTSKPAGIGTGLGLAICQRIVSSLGGEISFESRPDRGTVFRVQLLAAEREPAEAAAPRPSSETATRRGDVLVIDDDVMLCGLIRKALSEEHRVVCLPDARLALELLQGGSHFDVILCDVMMPHMTGAEFHSELARLRPELEARTMFLTGGAFTPDAREFVERLGKRCLEKPFDLDALRKIVRERMG